MDDRKPCQNGLGETASGGTNGPDPDYYNTGPTLRGRFRLSPVGIWRRHRYRRYSADRTHRLFVSRTRGIVISPAPRGQARPQRQARANVSISVTAATAPPSIPSIAARHTSFRVGN